MTRLVSVIDRFAQVDPRIAELQRELLFRHYIIIASAVVILLLIVLVVLQARMLSQSGKEWKPLSWVKRRRAKGRPRQRTSAPEARYALRGGLVPPPALPVPGSARRLSLARDLVAEKTAVIGRAEGAIRTYSTELIERHLGITVKIVEQRRARDIYELPEKIYEEYQIDIRREGRALISLPAAGGFREMGAWERIRITPDPDGTVETSYPTLEKKNPVRFRLGQSLHRDGKFARGYFEFHLYTEDAETPTRAGIPKVEKLFYVRLYRIYPGYDTGAATDEGLYPMIALRAAR